MSTSSTKPDSGHLQIVTSLFSSATSMADHLERPDEKAELQKAFDRFKEQTLYVVVCGECTRGKSSTVNMLLDEPDLCPVDAPAVTNAITIIRYGATERIVVHYSLRGVDQTEEITRDRIPEFVTEQRNEKNAKHVKLLEVFLPREILKGGLAIIDTPGLGSLNPHHAVATFSIAPNADVILFVSDATSELTSEEKEWAKKLISSPDVMINVVTRRDLTSAWRSIVDRNAEILAGALSCPIARIRSVGISNTLKLDYLREHFEADLKNSGYLELNCAISEILQISKLLIAMRAAGAIQKVGIDLLQPIECELQALTETQKGQLDKLEADLKGQQIELTRITENSSLWETTVQRETARVNAECSRQLNARFDFMHERINSDYLNRLDLLRDPSKLNALLAADIGQLVSSLPASLASTLEQSYARLREETKLDLALDFCYAGRTVDGPDAGRAGGMTLSDVAINFGRGAMMAQMGLAVAGGTVGAIIGGIGGTLFAPGMGTLVGAELGAKLGALVGGAIGTIAGLFKGAEAVKRDRRAKILDVLRPELNKLRSELDTQMREGGTLGVIALRESLLRAANRQKKICHESVTRIQSARALIQKDAISGRRATLTKQATELRSVIARCAEVIFAARQAGAARGSGVPTGQTATTPS